MESRFGPVVSDGATQFRLYAPSASNPELTLKGYGDLPMEKVPTGSG